MKLAVPFNFLVLLIFLLISSCARDHGATSQVSDSTLLGKFAKLIYYNYNSADRLNGVYNLKLEANQSFNTNFWGWDVANYYLTGGNLVVASIKTFDDPLPITSISYSTYYGFADGTTPYNRAESGVLRPKFVSDMTIADYDSSGTLTTPVTADTYLVTYDEQTGLPESYQATYYDTSGVKSSTQTNSFKIDPRDSNTFFLSSYILRDANDDEVGATTTTIDTSSDSSLIQETLTYRNFDANGDLGDFTGTNSSGTANSFGSANGSTVVKKESVTSKYLVATDDYAINSKVDAIYKYSAETTLVWQQLELTTYEDNFFGRPLTYLKTRHNVAASGGATTLTYQISKTYQDGLLSEEREYTVSGGSASLSTIKLYSYDDQGREILKETQDSGGTTTGKTTTTIDESTGKITTIRNVTVSASTGDESCAAGNYDKTYEEISNNGENFRRVTTTTYPCSGTKVSSSASRKIVNTYNLQMQPVLEQIYADYIGGAAVLTTQIGYSYSSTGAKTQKMTYAISSGVASKGSYINYSYDSNDFLIATINYDSSGNISAAYQIRAYSYK